MELLVIIVCDSRKIRKKSPAETVKYLTTQKGLSISSRRSYSGFPHLVIVVVTYLELHTFRPWSRLDVLIGINSERLGRQDVTVVRLLSDSISRLS